MRTINTSIIRDKISEMCKKACVKVDASITDSFKKSLESEDNPTAKKVMSQLIENYDIALRENLPICQDTGLVNVFFKIGQEIHFEGESLEKMVQEGIRIGYREGFLRKSIVKDPIIRENTGDNTPGVIHYEIVPGDKLEMTVLPKGAGCENMCRIKMLKPTEGIKGIKDFVINTVRESGANACPPLFIGVGIGGSFEKAAALSKEALLLSFEKKSELDHIAKLEKELFTELNNLDIGPQGFGGKTTALGIRILTHPTHIASLPVAVNISCHALRRESVII